MQTMKVKPWGEGQGDHVIINVEDFNPDFHVAYEEAATPKKPSRKPKGAQAEPVEPAQAAEGAEAAEGDQSEPEAQPEPEA